MLRRATLALVPIVLGLGLIAPAAGAGGNGAEVVNTPYECEDFGTYTYCMGGKSLFHRTETGSGNTNVVSHSRYEFRYRSGDCSSDSTSDYKAHYLYRNGEFQQDTFKSEGTWSYRCDGRTIECSFEIHHVTANGRIRHARTDFHSCRDV